MGDIYAQNVIQMVWGTQIQNAKGKLYEFSAKKSDC